MRDGRVVRRSRDGRAGRGGGWAAYTAFVAALRIVCCGAFAGSLAMYSVHVSQCPSNCWRAYVDRLWSGERSLNAGPAIAITRQTRHSNARTHGRRRAMGGQADGESDPRAGLRHLRQVIDEGASAQEAVAALSETVVANGRELLITEMSTLLQRAAQLRDAAETGALTRTLGSSQQAGAELDYLLSNLDAELIAELDTPWDVSVKKWRQKALAVEKYRSTNPTANAVVYTYMTNCCLRQGMWEVAYDALTYAGLMSAGPFFVSKVNVGPSSPAVVFDVDKMACYIAEKILDIDLDVWRRRGGDLEAGAGTVGNNKPGVGVEEINFSQKDDSATHVAALRVQDMTLATARVALRKIRNQLRDAGNASAPEGQKLVILASATTRARHLAELLLPPRVRHESAKAIETLLCVDFARAVAPDADLAKSLSGNSETATALGLLEEASLPIVVGGEALRLWIAQKDDEKQH